MSPLKKSSVIKKYFFIAVLIILSSSVLQAILISYKHLIDYVIIEGYSHFFIMLLKGTALSSALVALAVSADLKMIKILNNYLAWQRQFGSRLFVEAVISFISGGALGLLFTFISQLIFGYNEPLDEVLWSNLFIAAIVNIIIVTTIEAVQYFKQNRKNQLKAEILERENSEMRFNMLKRQLDPHFLFNSLNILSSLISQNEEKAQEFIDVFVSIYRYTLEVIDEPVVKVEDEIKFAENYLFLQKLRFGDAFSITINIENYCLDKYIPPLALQLLLENTFKHNIATKKNPLNIVITCDCGKGILLVKNNIQLKKRLDYKRGIGLDNLKKRYQYISKPMPEFQSSGENFIVSLPLINSE